MEKLRCAVLDDYQGVSTKIADWSSLSGQVEVTVFRDHFSREEERVAALASFDIIVVMRERTPFPAALFARLPRLRLLVTTGMRNAAIDLSAAAAHGVTVCGTASATEPPVELTWALILALARNIVGENGAFRQAGPWQGSVGVDLHGKRLGLLGLGKIGSRVAKVGAAFGMDVVAWSPNLT
ncbi:NAD(P)-dependent oxidoreductase, partial [Corallococcus terminator]